MPEGPPTFPWQGSQSSASQSQLAANRDIEILRLSRNQLDPDIPYHFLQEQEPGTDGPEQVNTIFLTSKECSFKCLMCDLWKNTLDGPTPPGAIVRQLDYALARLPAANAIKLYNNGNFFDPRAIPPVDYPDIVRRLSPYHRVVVENHPKLMGDTCLHFRDQLTGKLEIAMGLETIHPDVFPRLNKQSSPEEFRKATLFLTRHGIRVRAFVLLNPPYLTHEGDNIHWALETVRFAFENGAACCSIIATRPGNGIMEKLAAERQYIPPTLGALEETFESSLDIASGFHGSSDPASAKSLSEKNNEPVCQSPGQKLVFADTWDIRFLSRCPNCFEARKSRLEKMNIYQTKHQPIACSCHCAND